VATPIALFDFEQQTPRMRLIATAPAVKVEQVQAEMIFEPLVTRTVEKMAPAPEPLEGSIGEIINLL
jgi:hypothetical protein